MPEPGHLALGVAHRLRRRYHVGSVARPSLPGPRPRPGDTRWRAAGAGRVPVAARQQRRAPRRAGPAWSMLLRPWLRSSAAASPRSREIPRDHGSARRPCEPAWARGGARISTAPVRAIDLEGADHAHPVARLDAGRRVRVHAAQRARWRRASPRRSAISARRRLRLRVARRAPRRGRREGPAGRGRCPRRRSRAGRGPRPRQGHACAAARSPPRRRPGPGPRRR